MERRPAVILIWRGKYKSKPPAPLLVWPPSLIRGRCGLIRLPSTLPPLATPSHLPPPALIPWPRQCRPLILIGAEILMGAEILRGAEILMGAAILPDAEISTSALVLSYIVWRLDFTLCRSFPPKFWASASIS
jgi:hypothetical protein